MEILSPNEIVTCYGGILSSCDCYDENGQNKTHYDGGREMYKEIMCRYQCCDTDKKHSFQWGANINSSASIKKCSEQT